MKRGNIAVTMLPRKFGLSAKNLIVEIAGNYFLRASVITAQSITTKANNPSYVKVMEEKLRSTGQDLVITSQHMGSRPEHAPWQNKVFSYSGKNKKYPDFFKETGYGTAGGLKGVNCTHDFYPFWEGASVIPEDIKEPKPVKVNGREYTYYQATQQQRKMERDIRATKREIEAQKAIGGDTTELQSKLRGQTAAYKKFSADANLKVKQNRLRIVGGSSKLPTSKKRVAHSMNTGKKVYFDKSKSYNISLSGYSEKVNESLSKASKEVAKLGSENGYEYGVFVNLETGEIDKIYTDRLFSSVRPNYRYLKDNPNSKVAFIHNHNTDSELSFPDITLLANDVETNVVAAVRNDGIITVVESNGNKTSEYLPLKYLDYRNEVEKNMMQTNGCVDSVKVEIKVRDKAIDEYVQGGMQIYGNDT